MKKNKRNGISFYLGIEAIIEKEYKGIWEEYKQEVNEFNVFFAQIMIQICYAGITHLLHNPSDEGPSKRDNE